MNKYHAQKTFYNGILYDSKKESKRAFQLDLLQRAGRIHSLERQKRFTLLESFTNNKGEKVRAITYVADFAYYDNDRHAWIAEDSKGLATDVFVIKKKLFESKYPDWILDIT